MIFGQCLRLDEQLEWSMGSCASGDTVFTPWASYASAVASASVKSLVKSAVAWLGVRGLAASPPKALASSMALHAWNLDLPFRSTFLWCLFMALTCAVFDLPFSTTFSLLLEKTVYSVQAVLSVNGLPLPSV